LTRRGWWLFAAMSVIWGFPYLLIKLAVRDLSPASVVFLRTALGASLLLPLALARANFRPVLRRWRWVAVFTAVELAVPWVLLTDAERHVSSSLAGLMMASVPLVATLISRIGGNPEPIGARRLAGLAAGLAGVVVLLGFDVGGGQPLVLAKLALVVVCYAVGPVVIARRLSDLPTLEVVAASLALCALAYAPAGIALLPPTMPPPEVIAAVAGLGIVCTALAFLLFFQLVAEVGPVRANVVTYLNPAVAVVAGVGLLGEPFTAQAAAGLVLILGGSWLATGARGTGEGRVAVAPSRADDPPRSSAGWKAAGCD
jgi:drug/metabolite transporter (DMT)-like permease